MRRQPSSSRLRRRLWIAVYRTQRKLAKSWPIWVRLLPSWGISLALHVGVLLVMGVIYLAQPVEDEQTQFRGEVENFAPLGEDLTSLVKSDRAGDPYTSSTSQEFPSLGLDSNDKNLTVTAQPRLSEGARIGPTVKFSNLDVVAPSVRLTDVVVGKQVSGGTGLHVEDISAPFSGRDGLMKAKLIRRQGGTVESEKAVTAGLEWIARHQRPDGSWALDCHSRCQGEGCPPERSMESDIAATGLAILPMLGAGHSHVKEGRYQETIRRGVAWLLKQQKRDGELFLTGSFNTKFYTHAIATMALCEAYGISKDPALRLPAQRAINYVAKMQNLDDGGWRYFQGQPGDTSVFGWQIFALRSGRLAGLTIPKGVSNRCNLFLNIVQTDERGMTYGYLKGEAMSPVMTAEALLCRQYLGWRRETPALRLGSELVAAHLRESKERNIYYWYYATQMLHNMQDKDWKDWNLRLREGLISMQVGGKGCDRGSWDPNRPQVDTQGRKAGRLFTTALSVLTLEVYYRFLPLYRIPGEEDSEPSDEPKPAVAP